MKSFLTFALVGMLAACGGPIDLQGVANTSLVEVGGIEWKVSMVAENDRVWRASKADTYYTNGDHPKNHTDNMLKAIELVTGCTIDRKIDALDVAITFAKVKCES